MRLERGDVRLHRRIIGFSRGQHQLQRVVIPTAIIEVFAALIVGSDIDQPVITAATAHKIPPAAAGQDIIALATDKEVIAGTARELIIAFTADQLVPPATALEHVVALEADDEIITRTAAQNVVAARAEDEGALAHTVFSRS